MNKEEIKKLDAKNLVAQLISHAHTFGDFVKETQDFADEILCRLEPLVMQKTAEWTRVWDRLPEIGKPVIIETDYGKHDICYLRVEENTRLIWVNHMRPQHTNGSVIRWKEIE